MRGFAAGIVTLILLGRVVQPQASSALGSLFAFPARLAKSVLDPTIPTFKATSAQQQSNAESGVTTSATTSGGSSGRSSKTTTTTQPATTEV